MGPQEVVGRWRRWLLLGRWRGGKRCDGEAIELPRQHVLLHQMADLVEHGLLLLDRAHHHLEAVPRRRWRAHYPGGDAVVAGNEPRNLGADRLALLTGSVYEMLIERGDVRRDLLGARQEARAHGCQRTLNLVLNGLRLLAHHFLAVPIVRDPTNPAGESKYNWPPLARLASGGT